MIDSRAKGRHGELEVCRLLAPYWPQACPNLDQFSNDKRDVLNVPGLHIQVKWNERLNIWGALDQASGEASPLDLPVLAFRRNWSRSHLASRSCWFGAMDLSELLPLLKARET